MPRAPAATAAGVYSAGGWCRLRRAVLATISTNTGTALSFWRMICTTTPATRVDGCGVSADCIGNSSATVSSISRIRPTNTTYSTGTSTAAA